MRLPLDIEAKLSADSASRLHPDGIPHHVGNDYERHLYARHLRLQGQTRQEIAVCLLALGLKDVSRHRRDKYIQDILDSVLVGFEVDNPQPAYEVGDGQYRKIGGQS